MRTIRGHVEGKKIIGNIFESRGLVYGLVLEDLEVIGYDGGRRLFESVSELEQLFENWDFDVKWFVDDASYIV